MSAKGLHTRCDVWTESSLKNIFKDAAMPEIAKNSITWVAARNEYESAQIVLRADAPFTINTVSFTGLAGGDCVIPAGNLKYNFVEYCKLSGNTRDLANPIRKGSGDYPDPLSNEATITVAANTTQPIWITVYVPKSTAAATYTGSVMLVTTVGNFTVPISLEVADVCIPDSKDAVFTIANWSWTAGRFNFPDADDQIKIQYGYDRYTPQWWSLMDKFAQSMREHRINQFLVQTVTLLKDGGTTVDDNGRYAFGWSRFDEVVQRFMDMDVVKTLEGAHLAYRPPGQKYNFAVDILKKNAGGIMQRSLEPIGSQSADNWLNQFLPALKSHLQAKGWFDMWRQHLADEIDSPTEKDNWIALWNSVNTNAPGMKTLDAFGNQTYLKDLIGKVNVWVPNEEVHEANLAWYNDRKASDTVWLYTCCGRPAYLNRFIDQPVWMGRSLIWLAYKRNTPGFLHWGWNQWKYPIDGINGTDNGDPYVVYPDRANATIKNSIRHDAMRDGAEDFELFKILEKKDPVRARGIVDSVVTSGTNFSTDIGLMIRKREELVRAAAGKVKTDI